MKAHTFHVEGMHCQACVLLIQSELRELPEIKKVKVSLDSLSVEVTGDFGDKQLGHIARDLSEVLRRHGYTLSVEEQKHKSVEWSDFKIAIPAALLFIVIFVVLQKLGIVNLISGGKVTLGTAFVVGIVGGLLLYISASFAKQGET